MSIKFSVKMNEKYMYDFFLYNTYTRFSGILSLVLGVSCIVVTVYNFMNGSFVSAILTMIFAFLFLVMQPMQLKTSASSQVKRAPMFQQPLEYELCETGIIVRQEEKEAVNTWGDVAKVVSTKKCVIIYLNRVRAIILPKECMGEQYEAVLEILRTYLPNKKMRIKKK